MSVLTQIATLLLFQQAPDPASPLVESEPRRCQSATAPIQQPCRLPLRVSPAAAASLLGTQPWAWWLAGDQLTLIARPTTESVGILCCAIQEPVEPIPGSDLVGVTVRVPRIDEAFFDVAFPSPTMVREHDVYRGRLAPRAPAKAEPLLGRISVHDIDSAALGERRTISVYVPPGVAGSARLPSSIWPTARRASSQRCSRQPSPPATHVPR